MKLKGLLQDLTPAHVAGSLDVEVSGVTHDTRKLRKGDLFFALAGARTDGNRHVKDALAAGASAVVSELEPPPPPFTLPATWVQVSDVASAMGKIADRFFGRPSRELTVIGVTGTNGKTTTTYFLESIIGACGGTPGVIGTVDYRLAGAVLEKAPNTTPVSVELLRLLRRFKDAGATHAAMEVSSHALALKRADEVDFDAAIFTNLTREHLDFHKTMDDYLEAKARLFDLLGRASSSKKRRAAALNADDPASAKLRRRVVGADVVMFGLGKEADARAIIVESTASGTRFNLVFRGKLMPAQIQLVGEHNVYNALGAAAAALALGMPEEGVLAGLRGLARVPGRLEPVKAGQDFSLFVDYAHTDAALETVLGYLKKLPHSRLITVFGCGGDRDRTKRGPMGVAACRSSDLVFVTSDNPRSEDPARIIGDIEAGLKTTGLKNYKIQPDRASAIAAAVSEARPGDIVLIAGKGHEDYQILKDRTIHFDDREQARAAIEGRLR